MIKRNLENVEVFTYLCRPPLQGTDAALQASQVSLSQSTPELSRTTNFQTGFASCDVPQPPKSVLWSRCCTLGVWSLMALCFQTSQAGPRSAAEENILLRFYYLHYYCYAGPARLHPDSTFDYFLFNFINTLFEHLLPKWLKFSETLETSFLGAKYFCMLNFWFEN